MTTTTAHLWIMLSGLAVLGLVMALAHRRFVRDLRDISRRLDDVAGDLRLLEKRFERLTSPPSREDLAAGFQAAARYRSERREAQP